MLSEGRLHMLNMRWLSTLPGLAIFVTSLGVNLLGDGLCDFLDPRMKL
jgi:peptide/nickel transport system permease protein